jgi:hypothetical protein
VITLRQHAGENLADILSQRDANMKAIIQMADASSMNLPKSFIVLLCKCLDHAFRKFKDLQEFYPELCSHIMSELGKVYRNEEATIGMSPKRRLRYHKKHSEKTMRKLKHWLERKVEEKLFEPKSNIGRAFNYLLKHWPGLTRFLSVAGCPLSNSIVERALKIPIRNRKAAMFYKTCHGANIGSILTSLIYTATLAKVNPVEYLVALQKNKSAVFKNPDAWLPWNYHYNLEEPLKKAA